MNWKMFVSVFLVLLFTTFSRSGRHHPECEVLVGVYICGGYNVSPSVEVFPGVGGIESQCAELCANSEEWCAAWTLRYHDDGLSGTCWLKNIWDQCMGEGPVNEWTSGTRECGGGVWWL